jgi:quinol monooxygenase YgiN
MSEPILVIDRSDVREGRRAELETAVKALVEFVAANEPRVISYEVYLDDDDGTRMTVVQLHPDSASMENHMRLAASEFPGFADLLELRTMDVFGWPSETLLGQLRAKVEMLGDATIEVHSRHAGFARIR